ncbi:MAG: chorismate lyase [Immundisolibacter sp.]|uniref:chorismate--pyruvate lyase family protein n=1 Tax=Immundisolibacter sp. TaxID=1934948 RepID=UPI003D147639
MTSDWRPLGAAALRCLPAALRPWLADAGSLTAALRRALGGALDCTLLAHGWRAASEDEARYLGLTPGSRLFWRRVRFSHAGHAGRALLIGHTLAPPAVLAACPRLRRLGHRPVGELLFADPAVRRERIELAEPGSATLLSVPHALAARRALVPVSRGRLLVTEHFLPAMRRLPRPC